MANTQLVWASRLASLPIVFALSACAPLAFVKTTLDPFYQHISCKGAGKKWSCPTHFEEVYCIAAGQQPPSSRQGQCVDPAMAPITAAVTPPRRKKGFLDPTNIPPTRSRPPTTSGTRTPQAFMDTKGVCPDKPDVNLYNLDNNKNWLPTPCEAAVLAGAINECTAKSEDVLWWQPLGLLGGITATTVGLLQGPDALTGAGAATLFALATGTVPHGTADKMVTAAQGYAQVNQGVQPPKNDDYRTYPYYAALWNAAGSACPRSPLGPNFEAEDIDLKLASAPGNFQPRIPLSFTVTFRTGKETIPPNSDDWDKFKEKWAEVWPKYKADPTVTVNVLGNATITEMGQKGSDLPQKRANFVANALKEMKENRVDPHRIVTGVEKEPSDSALASVSIAIQP